MLDFSQVRAVCFDVDSTVCLDEGIDMLAAYCNKGELVSQMYVDVIRHFHNFPFSLVAA